MPRLIFKFDKDKDLWNYWNNCNKGLSFAKPIMDPRVIEICRGRSFEESKKDLSLYLSKIQNSNIISFDLEFIEKCWRKIEKEFFRRMDNLMKRKFDKDIIAYLTTFIVCPYNEDEPSFMFSLFYSIPKQMQICGHEIMHIYFHHFYWNDTRLQIGEEKTKDLKEALSVLLNLEFGDLFFVRDCGYKKHKKIRDFISKEWNKERDFEKLLKKCIKFMK